MRRLSVVITNYNYAQFVGAAVDSALALDWPDVEVVVIDDGSTDESLTVLETYAEQITLIAAHNAGQRAAANRAFAETTGDVVVFLDSDDVLMPDLARRLAPRWAPSVSKVQFRMQRIDDRGRPCGEPFPSWRSAPEPAEIRRWAARTSAYPSPPGSGNAYARWFLERVMPVGSEVGEAADSALLAAAPFFGDVLSLTEVLAQYRRHGGNDSNLLADPDRFAREVDRARARWRFAQAALGASQIDERPLRRSRELLQLRVAARRMQPSARPLPGDSAGRMVLDALTAPLHPGSDGPSRRLLISAWCLATLAAPQSFARRLITARYAEKAG